MFTHKMWRVVAENWSWFVADLLLLLIYILAIPRLSAFFSQQSILHGAMLLVVYLLFCASVLLIRKFPAALSGQSGPRRDLLALFALFFGIFVTFAISDAAGFFSRLDGISNPLSNKEALIVVAGVVLWIILVFLYMMVVLVKLKPFRSMSIPNRMLIDLLVVSGINMMILCITTFWNAYFSGIEPYEDLSIGMKLLLFLAAYIFFLLFFAPPRMLFLLKKPNWYAWPTFLLSTAYFVWDSLSKIAW